MIRVHNFFEIDRTYILFCEGKMAIVLIITDECSITWAELPGAPAEVMEAINSGRVSLPVSQPHGTPSASIQGRMVVVALAGLPAGGSRPGVTVSLTPREQQTLQSLADGLTVKQIAARLGCSQRTVRSHIQRLAAKLGARTKEQSVAQGLMLGLCQPPEAFLPERE
jgi:DNA-binding CsgD family transcriptional regulator